MSALGPSQYELTKDDYHQVLLGSLTPGFIWRMKLASSDDIRRWSIRNEFRVFCTRDLGLSFDYNHMPLEGISTQPPQLYLGNESGAEFIRDWATQMTSSYSLPEPEHSLSEVLQSETSPFFDLPPAPEVPNGEPLTTQYGYPMDNATSESASIAQDLVQGPKKRKLHDQPGITKQPSNLPEVMQNVINNNIVMDCIFIESASLASYQSKVFIDRLPTANLVSDQLIGYKREWKLSIMTNGKSPLFDSSIIP
ncbi:hypothetical protein ACHAP8_012449 [Fusarium lateritium]